MSNDSNNNGVMFSFLLGAAIGAGIALMLAPQSGSDTRRTVGDAARRVAGEAKSRLGQVKDTLSQVKESIGADRA